MHTRTVIIALVIGLILIGGTWARTPETVGSDAAEAGATATVTGTLQQDDCAWTLQSATDVYRIMLGRFSRSSEIKLSDGQQASVYGFVMGEAIAPITLTTDGQEYQLWSEDGRPVWARGRNDRQTTGRDRMNTRRSMPQRNSDLDVQRSPRNR